MMRKQKTLKHALLMTCIQLLVLASCKTASPGQEQPGQSLLISPEPEAALNTSVIEIDEFGDAVLEARQTDFSYGDSVSIVFSGGYSISEIPFYPDFFGKINDVIMCDYYDDHLVIGGISFDFCEAENIKAGERVTITLDERGKYLDLFHAYNIGSADDGWEGQSEDQFINARPLTGGSIREGIVYRSASPFVGTKTELAGKYLEKHQIRCVLDLADTEEELSQCEALPDYTENLIQSGSVICLPLGIDFTDEETYSTINRGIHEMLSHEGPYLIQCQLGRDRTAILASLFQGLCGAEYEEIVNDYMLSYYNLYHINMDPSSLQYSLFKDKLVGQLKDMYGMEEEQLEKANYEILARGYFTKCGLANEEIDRLRNLLEGK